MTELEDLLHRTAEAFELTPRDILSRSRKSRIVKPRHAFCYVAYMVLDYKYSSIGEFLGGRDHSTVVHAVSVAHDLREQDVVFDKRITQVINNMYRKRKKRLSLPVGVVDDDQKSILAAQSIRSLRLRTKCILNNAANGEPVDPEKVSTILKDFKLLEKKYEGKRLE